MTARTPRDGGQVPWDARDPRGPQEPQRGRRSRAAQDPRAARDLRAAQDPRAGQDPRSAQDPRSGRDPRSGQDPRSGRDPRDAQDPRSGRDPRDAQDTRSGRDPRDAQDTRAGRDPRDAQDPWGSRDGRPARHVAAAREWDDRQPPRRAGDQRPDEIEHAVAADRRLSMMGYAQAVLVGSAQILALLPGISRDGIVTVTGMWRGLSREDAVRYSFLLSAPVILAAGALKAHDLVGPMGKGIHGPVLVGSLLSGIGAYLSVRFLTRYFSEDRSLNPFGIYCLVAGLGSFVYLLLR